MLDKAEYSAFQSTLNSPIVSYRIVSFIQNLRNPAISKKFELMAVQGHLRSSLLGVSRKRKSLFIINSNFGRVSYRFRDIDAFSTKIAHFPTTPLFDAPLRMNALRYQHNLYYTKLKSTFNTVGYYSIVDNTGPTSFV